MNTASYIAILAILILLSGYFSTTETAFSSLNKTRIKTMIEKGNKRAKLVYELSEKYDKLISTILIGNNIVNIAASSIATVFFINLLQDEAKGTTLSTTVITIIVLIFGEISPKSIAKDCPEKFAMFSAPIINVLIILLTPINFLFSAWKKLLSRILKVEENAKMSQEELLMLVEEVQQEGSIDTDEGNLIRNAIEFTETRAEDILTHRVDIEAVSIESDKEEIATVFSQTKFSRILVYKESIDNIVGVIHQKDLYVNGKITDKSVTEIMTPPVFVQTSERINELLKELQKNKSHVAVVLDEYGGTFGIVTMEDILEELVGEIWDEHDEIVEEFKQIDDNTYDIDCSANFDDFCELFDIECESESVSVGGWVLENIDKMPQAGDKFEYENLSVTVTETDIHRVTKILVVCNEKEEIEE